MPAATPLPAHAGLEGIAQTIKAPRSQQSSHDLLARSPHVGSRPLSGTSQAGPQPPLTSQAGPQAFPANQAGLQQTPGSSQSGSLAPFSNQTGSQNPLASQTGPQAAALTSHLGPKSPLTDQTSPQSPSASQTGSQVPLTCQTAGPPAAAAAAAGTEPQKAQKQQCDKSRAACTRQFPDPSSNQEASVAAAAATVPLAEAGEEEASKPSGAPSGPKGGAERLPPGADEAQTGPRQAADRAETGRQQVCGRACGCWQAGCGGGDGGGGGRPCVAAAAAVAVAAHPAMAYSTRPRGYGPRGGHDSPPPPPPTAYTRTPPHAPPPALHRPATDSEDDEEGQQQTGEQELATKMLQIQSKRFYIDVKQNRRGRFMKVAEIGADGRRNQVFLALSTAAEFREHLSHFSDFYANLGPPNPETLPEDGKLKSETMVKDNRRYYLDLKENSRGRFLRVSQTIARGGPRCQIAIPAQGMIEFRDALQELLDEFGTDDGGYKGELPEGRHMRVENKNFYFDIGQNNRGIYMRISEVKTNFRTAITIPEKSWSRFRDIFSDYVEKMKEGGEKSGGGESK